MRDADKRIPRNALSLGLNSDWFKSLHQRVSQRQSESTLDRIGTLTPSRSFDLVPKVNH